MWAHWALLTIGQAAGQALHRKPMFINRVKNMIAIKPLHCKVALFITALKDIIVLLLITTGLFSCEEKNKKENADKKPATVYYTGVELDERLAAADSVVFVFFTDPFTADSLQYTRYYKQYASTAGSDIEALLSALNTSVTKEEKPRPCRNEGKAWVFTKAKIFQTIYFAWSKNNCAFIYLIKDGFFYYMEIKAPFVSTLESCRAKATEP